MSIVLKDILYLAGQYYLATLQKLSVSDVLKNPLTK